LQDKGNELFQLEVYNNAMKFYESVIKVDPTNKNILSIKGDELFKLKLYD